MAIPPPPQPTTDPRPSNGLPPIIRWMVAVIIVGGVAEWLGSNVSPYAGYGLVFIVLFGYALTGSNLSEFIAGLNALGIAVAPPRG